MSEQPNELVTEALDAVAGGRDLSAAEASAVLAEIMRGAVSPTQVASFLIALRTKGETVEELAGLAQTMRELAIRVDTSARDLLDTAGTGGGRRSFKSNRTTRKPGFRRFNVWLSRTARVLSTLWREPSGMKTCG